MGYLLQLAIGIPILTVFAGFWKHRALPDWLVLDRAARKGLYLILTYVAFAICMPIVYFGGAAFRDAGLSSYWAIAVAAPMMFALKYAFIRGAKIEFSAPQS